MRAIDPELQTRLDSGVTSLARCWMVRRVDGTVFGFTDHDKDLSFDGVTFRAESGMTAHALERSTGLSVDNGQAMGALSSIGLTPAELKAGLFDGAEVWHWLVDWERPDLRLLEFRGTLGEIRQSGGTFEVELRGVAEQLNKPIGRAFLKTCDRALGDAGCKVDTADPAFAGVATVVGTFGNRDVVVTGLDAYAGDWFTLGTVEWQSGANAGLRGEVRRDVIFGRERRIDLWQEAAFKVAPGDVLTVVAGCDKRHATCRDKFANLLNFRGFPHVPGDDWIAAYPNSSGVHDGSSLFTSD